MQKVALVIPCYNEEYRLNIHLIEELFAATNCKVFFANDGSSDGTLAILQMIATRFPERCFVLSSETNRGKANIVFESVNQINNKEEFDFIGYFDADFSTPVSQLQLLLEEIKSEHVKFAIASRMMVLNSNIKRKLHRHIIGRIIATVINSRFDLGIYDTQCGAKLFSKELIKIGFEKPFQTSWLFDVEIFIRLKKHQMLKYGSEIPIKDWNDVGGSKLGVKSMFKILAELFQILKLPKN